MTKYLYHLHILQVIILFLSSIGCEQETKSYQSLTASEGGHLNGVFELNADRFYCDETSLLEFVLCNINSNKYFSQYKNKTK